MIKDITIGQYFPGNSVVHKLDPRIKIVLTVFMIAELFVCKNFYSLALACSFSVFAVLISKISIRLIMKGMKSIAIIIVFTSLLQIFYNDKGTVLLEWWKIKITSSGLCTSAFMIVRIMALIFVSSLLTYTTSPTALTDGIERLLSPLNYIKIPVHTLAMMMTIALRFIPTLIDEIEKITDSQKARGADLETGGLVQRAKALVPVFVPLFVNSFRRAYELAFAMECRCYTGGEGRTRMKKFKLCARDYLSLVIVVLVLAGIIVLNYFFKAVI
ncbi:MAG: energy-coupling factor transporter transmembrane component T [Oscillospiraceae bacterium]|nr:energy-coupling factor transporter transmembrane protein EcfT [Oscillospiraceae bacterium]MDD7353853.1 energy-coupling factor transporter transmembrane component T [Oscillospiraceae bacterium]